MLLSLFYQHSVSHPVVRHQVVVLGHVLQNVQSGLVVPSFLLAYALQYLASLGPVALHIKLESKVELN